MKEESFSLALAVWTRLALEFLPITLCFVCVCFLLLRKDKHDKH